MTHDFLSAAPLPEFVEVRSQADLDRLSELAGHFHDCLLKELHILNSGHVLPGGSMVMGGTYTARLFFQRQAEDPFAVELIAGDVLHLELEGAVEIMGGGGHFNSDETTGFPRIRLAWDEGEIVCRRLLFRRAADMLGQSSRFGEEILLDPPPPQEKLGDGWVICKRCAAAWKSEGRKVLLCPECRDLGAPESHRESTTRDKGTDVRDPGAPPGITTRRS